MIDVREEVLHAHGNGQDCPPKAPPAALALLATLENIHAARFNSQREQEEVEAAKDHGAADLVAAFHEHAATIDADRELEAAQHDVTRAAIASNRRQLRDVVDVAQFATATAAELEELLARAADAGEQAFEDARQRATKRAREIYAAESKANRLGGPGQLLLNKLTAGAPVRIPTHASFVERAERRKRAARDATLAIARVVDVEARVRKLLLASSPPVAPTAAAETPTKQIFRIGDFWNRYPQVTALKGRR